MKNRKKKGTRIFPFSNVFVFKRLNASTNTNIMFYVYTYSNTSSLGFLFFMILHSRWTCEFDMFSLFGQAWGTNFVLSLLIYGYTQWRKLTKLTNMCFLENRITYGVLRLETSHFMKWYVLWIASGDNNVLPKFIVWSN